MAGGMCMALPGAACGEEGGEAQVLCACRQTLHTPNTPTTLQAPCKHTAFLGLTSTCAHTPSPYATPAQMFEKLKVQVDASDKARRAQVATEQAAAARELALVEQLRRLERQKEALQKLCRSLQQDQKGERAQEAAEQEQGSTEGGAAATAEDVQLPAPAGGGAAAEEQLEQPATPVGGSDAQPDAEAVAAQAQAAAPELAEAEELQQPAPTDATE